METHTVKMGKKNFEAFCTKTYTSAAGEVKNAYACGQSKFTVTDAWNILKNKSRLRVK